MPRAHTVERAKKHLSRLCKTITIRKMTRSTIHEIIFKKLAAVIKSSEVVKKLSLKQQYLSPSPIPVPCPTPITTLVTTVSHNVSRERHLQCSLFLGKHWQARCCRTPAMCKSVAQMWPVNFAEFLIHYQTWESQEDWSWEQTWFYNLQNQSEHRHLTLPLSLCYWWMVHRNHI